MTGSDDGAAMQAAPDSFGMTDTEEKLRGPDGAAARDEILSALGKLRAKVELKINQGLRPDEYAKAQTLLNALAIACEAVVRL